MDNLEYKAGLEKLDDIVAAISKRSFTVELGDYRTFRELASTLDGSVTDRIKRCDALIKAVSCIIETAESDIKLPVCSKLDHAISFDPNISDSLQSLSFNGLTEIGRHLVDQAGELVFSDLCHVVKHHDFMLDLVLPVVTGCRRIGAAVHAYKILVGLEKLGIRDLRINLEIIDLLADPDIKVMPYARLADKYVIIYRELLKAPATIVGTLAKRDIHIKRIKNEAAILADFVLALDGDPYVDVSDDYDLLELIEKRIKQALPMLTSCEDYAKLLVRIPKALIENDDIHSDSVTSIVDAAIEKDKIGVAIATAILLKQQGTALAIIRDYPDVMHDLDKVFDQISEIAGVIPSRLMAPAIENFSIQCKRWANISALPLCPVEEMCIIHTAPSKIYNTVESKLAKVLLDPYQSGIYDLLDIDWWKFSPEIVSMILDNWSVAIVRDNDPLNTAEDLIHQLERCPDHAIVYSKCSHALGRRIELMSHEFRLAMAKSAVERGNSQYACSMLDGWKMSDFWEKAGDILGFFPGNWDALYMAARKAGKSGGVVLRALANCLPENSCEKLFISQNACAISAMAAALEENYLEAYQVLKNRINQIEALNEQRVPLLHIMGYLCAYKANLLREALIEANQIRTMHGGRNSRLKTCGIDQLLNSVDIGMVNLLVAKLSGFEDDAALSMYQETNALMEFLQSPSETISDESKDELFKIEKLASAIIRHYMGRGDNERLLHIHDNSTTAVMILGDFYKKDGKPLFEIRMRMAIASMTIEKASKDNSYTPIQLWLFKEMNDLLHQQHGKLLIERQREADEARIAERDQVISDLSHHIKNLVAKVLDPLQRLKSKDIDAQTLTTVDNAMKGGALIREIVNAMNLSYRGNSEDYRQDATLVCENAQSLESLLASALISALANMFDGKYFSRFLKAYFPERELFTDSKTAFDRIVQQEPVSLEDLVDFARASMCDIDLDIAGMGELYLRDTNGSQVKMLIVLNEMLLNAIKYTAEQERGKRFVSVRFTREDKHCVIRIENSCKPRKLKADTGLGHVVLQNFAKIMGGVCEASSQDGGYCLSFTFADFWKGCA